MTVLVTGISGLLGANLVFLLLEKGYRVKGLARNITNLPFDDHPQLNLIESELTAIGAEELDGVDCIIHAAAVTRQDLINYKDYYTVNYTATTHLIEQAITAGVSKFIYVSTANTIGYGIGTAIEIPEDKPMRAPFTRSLYARSKAAAEAYLLQQTDRIHLHIVNPTFMIGPHDSKPSSGAIIVMAMQQRVVFYPPGGKNFVAVKDVAAAIEKSIYLGANGRRYLLAGDNISYRRFFKIVKTCTQRKQWLVPLPAILLRLAGYIGDILRLFGVQTSLCSNNMQILCIKNFYSNRTSISALQAGYQDLRNAIKESIAYFEKRSSKI